VFLQILSVLLPVFFVLLLGYLAGRAKAFDSDQVAGLSELVLDFALPASLFVGTVRTPLAQLLQQGPLFLALFISLVGFYLVVLLLGRLIVRHTLADAALQAICVAFPAAPFFGTAILSGVYGSSSAVAISILAIIGNVVLVPLTIVLCAISQAAELGGAKVSSGTVIGQSLLHAVKAPVVWAPILGVVLVLIGVSVPSVIDSMLNLIGSATSGVALFVAGLSIAAGKISFGLETGVNTVLKMLVQPALFLLLALALGVKQPGGHEGFIMCAFPTAVIGVMLATRYKTYQTEASSTLALTSILMILTLPLAFYVIGGA
jgi:malonate transporter and related proteins